MSADFEGMEVEDMYLKLRQLLRATSKIYDYELARVGLRATQYSTLSHLAIEAPIGFRALAENLKMDKSTLSRNLRVLVKSGLAELVPGDDRRNRNVMITATGKEKLMLAKTHWVNAQHQLLTRLGEKRIGRLHNLVEETLKIL